MVEVIADIVPGDGTGRDGTGGVRRGNWELVFVALFSPFLFF